MHVANDSVFIHNEADRRVVALCAIEPPAFECAPVAVESNGKFEFVLRCCSLHPVRVPVSRRLGMENANYLKALAAVFFLELAQRGSGGCTQIAGIGPP